jgi:hypothetical protein
MNHSFFERTRPNRLARPPPAATLRWLPAIPRKKTGAELSSGSTRGYPPPTFTIASPGQNEGEAMVKAGGGRKEV